MASSIELGILLSILEKGASASLAVATGAILANLLVPRWQASFARTQARSERIVQIAEDVASNFALYINNWARVVELAKYAAVASNEERKKLAEEKTLEAAAQRNASRDDLLASIARLKLYCNEVEVCVIDDFLRWDGRQTVKSIDELPSLRDWLEWERRVLQCISSRL